MYLGCIFSKYDARDYTLVSSVVSNSSLPKEFINENIGEVKHQGQVGSCVAHALSTILEFHAGMRNKELSTNFIYGIQKELFNIDTKGMVLRDACAIVTDYGDMLEKDCPGNDEVPVCHNIAFNALSDNAKLNRAYEYRIKSYYKCRSINDIKYALINHGPVLGALKWYNEYIVDKDGVLTGTPKKYRGGHAVVIYGYNEKGFLCQNSWGKYWGNRGRFIVPYNIKFREARGIIDHKNPRENDDIKRYHTGSWWNTLYKAVNAVVNLVYKIIYK